MHNIDLATLSDEEKYQLYQALERDLGMYSIALLFRSDLEDTIECRMENDAETERPTKEGIDLAINYVINKMPAFDSDHIHEWVIEKAFEIEESRAKEFQNV